MPWCAAYEPGESLFISPNFLAHYPALQIQCSEDQTQAQQFEIGRREREGPPKGREGPIAHTIIRCLPVTGEPGPEIDPGIPQPEKENCGCTEYSNVDEIRHDYELTYYTPFHICIVKTMQPNQSVREILSRYKKGDITLEEASREIEGHRLEHVGDFACIDLGRKVRCGMPEVVLAEGKDPSHLSEIAVRHAEVSGRCVITRVSSEQVAYIQSLAKSRNLTAEYRKNGRVMVLSNGVHVRSTGGIVAIMTAGTSDIRVAEEAKIIAEEMGCKVHTAYDVGAAGIHRLFPALKPLMDAHVFIVCAGREGTLPSIVAGLVDKPVIGVPVSVGYGYMGLGRAALASMLQSCSVISVVNIDAGFTAGAFAARIANMGAGAQGERP